MDFQQLTDALTTAFYEADIEVDVAESGVRVLNSNVCVALANDGYRLGLDGPDFCYTLDFSYEDLSKLVETIKRINYKW